MTQGVMTPPNPPSSPSTASLSGAARCWHSNAYFSLFSSLFFFDPPDSCTAANKPFFSGRRRDKFIDKRCNNHRRIVAYGVLNCATSPTDHAMVDPGSYRFWVRNDSVLTTTCGSPLRSNTQ